MTRDEIKQAVAEALEEHRKDFLIEAEEHYQHHLQLKSCVRSRDEWLENHKFVSDIRANGKIAQQQLLACLLLRFLDGF